MTDLWSLPDSTVHTKCRAKDAETDCRFLLYRHHEYWCSAALMNLKEYMIKKEGLTEDGANRAIREMYKLEINCSGPPGFERIEPTREYV